MSVLVGQIFKSAIGSLVAATLSSSMGQFGVDYWPPHAVVEGPTPIGALVSNLPVSVSPRVLVGSIPRSYVRDFYYRVHVIPQQIDLGNLVISQVRNIDVWNAWPDTAQTLDDFLTLNTSGIIITTPGAPPLHFNPLQQRTWTLQIDTRGAPIINATLQWQFDGLAPLFAVITGNRITAWMLPADWSSPVVETLAWLTDVEQALDGSEYREPIRDTPRRQWEFDAVAQGADRQRLEAVMYDWNGRNWALPVWPDVTYLATPLAAGSNAIPVATSGRDFNVGSLLMLWTATDAYELLEVGAIASDHITLAAVTGQDWPAQTRVYPCRISRLTDIPKITRKSDRIITTSARFEATEPCDWPAVAPTASYLGLPVLEDRIDETSDPSAAYGRQLTDLDGDVGMVLVDDITGLAWPTQSHAWLSMGITARSTLRSNLYWLQGTANTLWVPSWADDLTLQAPVTVDAVAITVVNIGVAAHLAQQPGRRHLRIELFDGTVFYRRVTNSSVVDDTHELLNIDTALGRAISAADVRQINWMMLARLASDSVQIAHANTLEGDANVAVNWMGVGAEEP